MYTALHCISVWVVTHFCIGNRHFQKKLHYSVKFSIKCLDAIPVCCYTSHHIPRDFIFTFLMLKSKHWMTFSFKANISCCLCNHNEAILMHSTAEGIALEFAPDLLWFFVTIHFPHTRGKILSDIHDAYLYY